MNLKNIKTRSLSTAGVTVKDHSFVLYWNPDFVGKLSKRKGQLEERIHYQN